ncbi:E3 ubiquitin-protein ligase RNF31-like [Aphelocoma coerulescens]
MGLGRVWGGILRLPLPPGRKLRRLDGARLLRDNLEWDPQGPPRGLASLRTALSILEKYGRNLLSPRPPRHWRAVRFGNPVFRSTVGAIQGGRSVLRLLGYTQESGEGLSFPPPPAGPQRPLVAAVTAEVLLLRAELDLLLQNRHPNPQFFTEILLGGDEWPLASDALPAASEVLPAGGAAPPEEGVGEGRGWSCRSCTFRNPSPHVLCQVCERPRLARRPPPRPEPAQAWPCPRCTFLNPGPSPTCEACGEAPPPAGDVTSCQPTPPPAAVPATSGLDPPTSGSSHAPSGLDPPTSGSGHAPSGLETTTSCVGHASSGLNDVTSGFDSAPSGGGISTSGCGPAPSRDALRQRKMLEEGRRLVALVRAAESQGLPPESLSPSLLAPPPPGPSPTSPESQIRLFRSHLGGVLKALQGAEPEGGGASLGPFSLAEAAWAWLEGEGSLDRARRALIGRRKQQTGFSCSKPVETAPNQSEPVHIGPYWSELVRTGPYWSQLQLLSGLGFPERAAAAAALQRHGGGHWGALCELQGRRLRPLRLRHFRGEEPGLDFNRADQQALVRQILATLPVASWGRASLVAGLGGGGCYWFVLMQWLPGCSCPLCPECFRLHFTVGVRERGVAALGCPSCGRPDLRDEAQRLCYWSTLEPRLRHCLDPDTFGLVTRKLTELELLRDPQFLWCPHCSFGFIFEGERGPAQCPQCHQCCCPRCQLPWDPRHAALSCAEFGAWIGSRDPPGPPPGLGAFLGELGIVCPQCSQCFALARGGCLHFQCSQCQHQFCAGCGAQFHRPESCPSPQCPLRGSLHGHHPRDCLFYLRDWEPRRLQQLLLDGNVPFETEPPPDAPPNPSGETGRDWEGLGGNWEGLGGNWEAAAPVPEQKQLGVTLRDEPCGRCAPKGHAGLCRPHYSEYLVSLINRHGLDPARLYDRAELRAAAERHLAAGRARRRPGESEAELEARLRHLLEEEAPVRPRPPGPLRTRPLCK